MTNSLNFAQFFVKFISLRTADVIRIVSAAGIKLLVFEEISFACQSDLANDRPTFAGRLQRILVIERTQDT